MRHRAIAKRLAPAFSKKKLIGKEATILKHIDLFIQSMKEIGAEKYGIELRCWTDRLGLDPSADMVYGREMSQVRDSEKQLFPILHLTS
jgi:hypothetical protein